MRGLKFLALMIASVALASAAGADTTRSLQPSGSVPSHTAVLVPPKESEITTTATARVYRKPEYLDVIVGVDTSANEATAAYNDCSQKMEAVIKSLRTLNLKGVEFQTGTVALSPRYNDHEAYKQGQPRKIIGYSAINTLRIRTTELQAAPAIIDRALAQGANRVDGVSFNVKDVLEAREEALRAATKAAKRKAHVMADALDRTLGRVISIVETTQNNSPWYGARMAQVNDSMERGGGSDADASIEPGMIEIVVDVSLTLALQ